MTRDNSQYIHKSSTGEYFDIRAYEDDEQMRYLAERRKKNQTNRTISSVKKSSIFSRLISGKTR